MEALWRRALEVRAGVAALAGLRWARAGRFGLAVPAAVALTVVGFRDQLGARVDLAFGLTFVWLWLALAILALLALRLSPAIVGAGSPGGRPWLGMGLAVWVVTGWIAYDLLIWQGPNHLYDLDVYLASAGRWVSGGQPYMTGPVSAWPASPNNDFFLYPPPLLPVFGLLSRLPDQPVVAGWIAFLVACAYTAFRALGLRRSWSLALLAFPPVMVGFESGNVASLTFLLFALGYRAGGSLVVDGLIKVQTGLTTLWLVRAGRWRGLALGLVLVAGVALLTLPLVGLDSWRAWLAGLGYRTQSQSVVESLYGFSYARLVPGVVFAAAAVGVVALALLFSGRRGLAAFGLASIMASPALWPHGFVFALPAVLMLESGALVLLVLGAGCAGAGMWLLFYAGWIAVIAAPRVPDTLHPLAGTDGPWPRALTIGTSRPRASSGDDA